MDVMERRRMLIGSHELPSMYKRVEYIQSTGTQYINTGIIGKPGIEVTSELSFNTDSNTYNVGMLGSRESSGNTRFYLISLATYRWHVGMGSDAYYDNAVVDHKYAHHIAVTNQGFILTIDGTTYTNTAKQTTSYPMYLFACNNYGTAARHCKAKLYKMRIKVDGILVRDFIPCYRKSDSVAGLYDIVNGVFYTNQGTGTFVIPT